MPCFMKNRLCWLYTDCDLSVEVLQGTYADIILVLWLFFPSYKIQLHLPNPVVSPPVALTLCATSSNVIIAVPPYWKVSMLSCLLLEELILNLFQRMSFILSDNPFLLGRVWKATPVSCHPAMSTSCCNSQFFASSILWLWYCETPIQFTFWLTIRTWFVSFSTKWSPNVFFCWILFFFSSSFLLSGFMYGWIKKALFVDGDVVWQLGLLLLSESFSFNWFFIHDVYFLFFDKHINLIVPPFPPVPSFYNLQM